ncbi:MAG: lysophospholipid acyltransferase family protein, partial [Chloroflexi bacterium]|nr:lysophospholipid acyltransferase family protein [Chloroflexota bacterium]
VSNPTKGFQFLNALREEAGAEITPISPASIRQALRRLRDGGVVFTGVDYPAGSGRIPLRFFGRTALLPTGHVRLALMSNALLLVVFVLPREGGGYTLHALPPLELIRLDDRREEERVNAERVLRLLEEWIGAHPEHWFMFLPVWPELLPARYRRPEEGVHPVDAENTEKNA